jgi:hypothetical protein
VARGRGAGWGAEVVRELSRWKYLSSSGRFHLALFTSGRVTRGWDNMVIPHLNLFPGNIHHSHI